jgi:hypothetical protein
MQTQAILDAEISGFQDLRPHPKTRRLFFGEIIRRNGFGGETVRQFLKELPTLP